MLLLPHQFYVDKRSISKIKLKIDIIVNEFQNLKHKIMRWLGGEESDNVEDGGSGGGGRNLGIGGGIIGIVGFVIYLFTGYNPTQLLNQAQGNQQQTTQNVQQPLSPQDSLNVKFARVILKDTETTWGKIFSDMGQTYEKPKLVHFQNSIDASGCGMASSATGPFYCPADRKVYLDFSFFDELSNRFHAGGDFAKAYVIAHEVGHHVQNLLGLSAKMDQMRQQMSRNGLQQNVGKVGVAG